MKTTAILVPLVAALPSALAWGSLGHETVAYVASNFVSPATRTFAQKILADTSGDYLANVATWADSFRYTSAGSFSRPFHYIDALDNPPHACSVDYARDCGAGGCIVRAISNYTGILQRHASVSATQSNQALSFLVHFLGDIHQPLHDENLDVGGNTVSVTFNGASTNLHAAWDTSIPEQFAGASSLTHAQAFAAKLSTAIRSGAYSAQAHGWVAGLNLTSPTTSAMAWAADANSYVCSTVIPNGVSAVQGTDLGGAYYTKVVPTVEVLLARAGYRLAAWLNLIATGSTGGL